MWILSVPVLPTCALLLFITIYSACNESFIKCYKTNFFHILDLATAKLVAVYLEVFPIIIFLQVLSFPQRICSLVSMQGLAAGGSMRHSVRLICQNTVTCRI